MNQFFQNMDYNSLDSEIIERDFDAFVSFRNASDENQYYLTKFNCHSNFLFVRTGGKSIILTPHLEVKRAIEQAEVDEVYSMNEYIQDDIRGRENKENKLIKRFLEDFNISSVLLMPDVSYNTVKSFENLGLRTGILENSILGFRKKKSREEIKMLREAQKQTEKAMDFARKILSGCEVSEEGFLIYNGDKLTSDILKKEIHKFLIDRGFSIKEFIIVSGKEGYNPHNYGSGVLHENEPILLDIFPRNNENKYWGDMTRTFVKGEVSEEVNQMYEATKEAFDKSLEVLEEGAGVKCCEIHNSVCDVYEKHGFDTIRDGNIEEGFLHSTGHGIGLSLHEPPRIAGNEDILKEGYAVTIEPGLYKKNIGAVRFEDMIIVRKDGYENVNDFDYSMSLD